MPHITQIGAVEIDFGESFSTYVVPRIPIEPRAKQTVIEHQLMPLAGPILEALSNFLTWLSTYKSDTCCTQWSCF